MFLRKIKYSDKNIKQISVTLTSLFWKIIAIYIISIVRNKWLCQQGIWQLILSY